VPVNQTNSPSPVRKGNTIYIMSLTLVATLGGLLFGYDTAVISGTVGALKNVFITPLANNPIEAKAVIIEYKIVGSLCFAIMAALICSFLFKLYGKSKGGFYSLALVLIASLIVYFNFITLPNELTETMANSLNGFIISSALLGCVIGGSIGGYIADTMGRKNGLIIAAILFTISAIGSAIPDYMNFFGAQLSTSFIFYRVVGGVGVGLASMLSPMYIAEIAPAGIRGKLVSWNQFAIVFGMLVVYFVNYFIARGQPDEWINEIGWRWMFASEVVPCILFLFFLFFVPETPRFLVMKDRAPEAKNILQKLGDPNVDSVLADIKESMLSRNAPWLSFGGLVLIIGILLSVFQQFVGINVVLYYAPEIFRNMGSGTDFSLLQTIIVGAINLIFTVIAIFTVDKLGRKPLQIIGALGMAVGMVWLGLSFHLTDGSPGIGALFAMLVYTAAFALSWGPVVWVLLSEIFPNSIRGAMSIAVAAQWIANLVVSWTFPIMNDSTMLNDKFHHGFSYWVYGFMSLLAAWFMWKVVPETKGKTLEEMQHIWEIKK
jgi:MFS transporter, SP family, xylose:H+ symportor